MKLLIVIVSYRVTDLTIDCLRSLREEVAALEGVRVAVCENGTGPEAVEKLRRAVDDNGWGGWVELWAVYPNRGFTGGNNAVIRPALARADVPEYFLLLNADTIVHTGAIRALLEFMDAHPRAGIAGSRLENPDGSRQGSPFRFQGIATELDRGARLGLLSRLLRRWSVVVDEADIAGPTRVDWVSGASMIVRREVFQQIGPLDEDLYTYFDDIDICWNARKAGWETWYVPQSRILHLEGASTGIGSNPHLPPKRRPDYWFQARRRFFLKNYGPVYTALADAAFIAGLATWRLRRWLQAKPDTDPPHMLADAIRHSVFVSGMRLRAVENPAVKQFIASGGDPAEVNRPAQRIAPQVTAAKTCGFDRCEPHPGG